MKKREFIELLRIAATDPTKNDKAHELYCDTFSTSFAISQQKFLASIVESYCNNLDSWEDWELNNPSTLDENLYNFAESCLDVYTHNLTDWLNQSTHNIEYLTRAMQDGLTDGVELIRQAQYLAIIDICSVVIASLLDCDEDTNEAQN